MRRFRLLPFLLRSAALPRGWVMINFERIFQAPGGIRTSGLSVVRRFLTAAGASRTASS